MNKVINYIKTTWNEIKNETFWTSTGFITGAVISFMLTTSAWESAVSRNKDEVRIENVRHFIEHPSMYKLDTLYRKVNDTLYIDTIKVNYNK